MAELPLGDWPALGLRAARDEVWPRSAPPELLALRRRVLADDPSCVQQLPGHDAAVAELAPDGLATLAVGQPDDVCLVTPESGWPLVAGAVLFPSHWHLRDKVGRPLAAVHQRVPGYPGEQVDRFLDRLRPGVVAWRRNVLFHRSADLHAPMPVDDGSGWWLRSERQTFRRLPRTGAVVFTIATDTCRVDDLDPVDRRRLAAWLRATPPGWAPYAGVDLDVLLTSVDPEAEQDA